VARVFQQPTPVPVEAFEPEQSEAADSVEESRASSHTFVADDVITPEG
jgi:hypothetical protein